MRWPTRQRDRANHQPGLIGSFLALDETPPVRQVRWGTFATGVADRKWIDCWWAEVRGEVLAISLPEEGSYVYVPLHVIRGEIEYRLAPQAGQDGAA